MRKSDANEERALEVKLREKTTSPCAAAVQTSEQRVEPRALPLSANLLFFALSRFSVFVVQCHGVVYVEKQCPQVEEVFLCCGMAQHQVV